MKKRIILRGLAGIPIGISISYLITIFLSLGFGKGSYSPCVPELVDVAGNEINAVLIQILSSIILGAGFGMLSLIWEIDSWGIVKRTGIFFFGASLIMLPTAYFTFWMEHSVSGFLGYFGIFALIFAAVWIIQYTTGKRNVKILNNGLHNSNKDL